MFEASYLLGIVQLRLLADIVPDIPEGRTWETGKFSSGLSYARLHKAATPVSSGGRYR